MMLAFHDVGPYKECFETAGDTTQQLLAQKWLTQSRRDAETQSSDTVKRRKP